MAKRRRFSAKFKREAVELTRRPQASVAIAGRKSWSCLRILRATRIIWSRPRSATCMPRPAALR